MKKPISESQEAFSKLNGPMAYHMNNKGGKREGAGRKPIAEKSKSRTIRLTDSEWLKLKSLGGAQWVKDILNVLKKT